DFLDELANEKVIVVNTAVKPYSRRFIAEKLVEARDKSAKLNNRQKKEIEYYLRDYIKDLPIEQTDKKHNDILFYQWGDSVYKQEKRWDFYHYRDKRFSFTVNPVVGMHAMMNDSGLVYHRWNGAEGYASVGEHFGFYANLRDNYENEAFATPEYINPYTGATFKGSNRPEKTGVEYSYMRGGLMFNWDWGEIGIIKDHVVWGNNYHGSNILSGKTPSFAMIKLKLSPASWIDFNYIHGWLVSEVVDSSRSYYYFSAPREVFHDKYIAANLYTIKPFRYTSFSFGNSIIYSDLGVHPAYLIPFLFYKSVDHTYNSTNNYTGQNSQMFFDFSTRQLKHLHLYATLFVDEIYISKIRDTADHSNFFSYKAGFQLSNLIPNLFFTAEYTVNRPITYEHFMPTTTFESNSYNLGSYLRHNAREIFIELKYRPFPKLTTAIGFCYAEKGPDIQYVGGAQIRGLDLIESIEWKYQQIEFRANYQVMHDVYSFVRFRATNITGNDLQKYTPEYLQGRLNTTEVGLSWSF
ncbi:MAG: hypothetical protein C0594_04975, partial [Marinilabiliales bacterium]